MVEGGFTVVTIIQLIGLQLNQRGSKGLCLRVLSSLLLHSKGSVGRVINGLYLIWNHPPSIPRAVQRWPICGLLSISYVCIWPGAGLLQGSSGVLGGAGCPDKSQDFSWTSPSWEHSAGTQGRGDRDREGWPPSSSITRLPNGTGEGASGMDEVDRGLATRTH